MGSTISPQREKDTSVPEILSLPWVESPFFQDNLKESNLDARTKELVRSYAQEGYIIIDCGLSETEIEQVILDLKDQYKNGVYAYDSRIQDAWKTHESVRRVACAPRVIEQIELLYRKTAIPFQTLNFHVGTQQRAHSDSLHFNSIPQRFLCGVWVALEDVDAANGPLFFYPKSHRLAFFDLEDFGLQQEPSGYVRYEECIAALMDAQNLPRKELHLKKGQAIIWAANLVHGGTNVLDRDRTRYSQATHYYFSGCLYYAPMGSHLISGKIQLKSITDVRTGKRVPHMWNGVEIQKWPPSPVDPRSEKSSLLQRAMRLLDTRFRR